ncbi:MAG: T9SS type A sorting domain-containing protein [Ignavibacteriales bacterium]|nr:T9SS type A sorting domain-containing protein [Ignavibacteriales bacterium]
MDTIDNNTEAHPYKFIMNKNVHETQFIPKFSHQILFFLFLGILFLTSSSRSQIFSCDLNWQPTVQLSRDSVISLNPKISVNGSGVHIIWFGIDTLGGLNGSGIVYSHSFDNGLTFSEPVTIVTPEAAFGPGYIAQSGYNIFITFNGYIGGVFGIGYIKSSDAGFSWSSPVILRSSSQPKFIAAYDSVVIIHYGDQKPSYSGMLRSGNYGSTWRTATTSMQPLNDVWLTSSLYHGAGAIASTRRTDVGYYFSPTGGSSWYGPELISLEDAVSSLYPKIAVDEMDEKYFVWNDSGAVIFRRSNGLDEEENIRWNPQKKLPASRDAIFPDLDYTEGLLTVIWDTQAGDSSTIVLQHSTDKGESFCDPFYPAGNYRSAEPAMSMQDNTLSIVWSGNVDGNGEIFFRRGIFPGETRPKATMLKQNYPNPFNNFTTIEYEITREGLVKLEVFDLLGRKIETLVHDIQKPRRYSVKFNGSNLSSGVYFCRLRTIQFAETKKMIVLR